MSTGPQIKVVEGLKYSAPDRGVSGPSSPRPTQEGPTARVAREVLRRLVEEKALKFRTHGLLLRTLRHSRLVRLAREYSWRYGVKPEAVLTYCGWLLSRYSRPLRRSKPRVYAVTSTLVGYLFGVSWEKLRERPLYSLDPVEDYYVALVIEEWCDGYSMEEGEE